MQIFNTGVDARHHDKTGLDTYTIFLAHQSEPMDYYQKNNDGHDGLRNLFDDSDTKDKRWFKLARGYLEKASSSSERLRN